MGTKPFTSGLFDSPASNSVSLLPVREHHEMLRLILFLIAAVATRLTAAAAVSVEIDLEEQRAYLLENRRVVLETPISSGRAGHHTRAGRFKVTEKDLNHRSSIYGKIIDARGRTLIADADTDMPVSAGGRFVPAPMRYFLRFDGANGMHAGYLPGYAASHGCVRLPEEMAKAFYRAVEIGTPVNVFGKTPPGRRRGQGRGHNWKEEEEWFEREPGPRGIAAAGGGESIWENACRMVTARPI